MATGPSFFYEYNRQPTRAISPLLKAAVERGQLDSVAPDRIVFRESNETVEIRKPGFLTQVKSHLPSNILYSAIAVAPTIGFLALGPPGFALGVAASLVAGGGLRYASQTSSSLRDRLLDSAMVGVACAAWGSMCGIFAPSGALIAAGAAGGGALAASVGVGLGNKKAAPGLNLKTFAPAYLERFTTKLAQEQLPLPEVLRQQKDSSSALVEAVYHCAQMFSPAAAVQLAVETATSIVPRNSLEEARVEGLCKDPLATARLGTSDVHNHSLLGGSPGVATTRYVLLKYDIRSTYSDEAIAFMIEHERSHVQNRDVVGSLGATTLLGALKGESESALPPLKRLRLGRLQDQIELAVAQEFQSTETRADLEAAQALLQLGADKKTILDSAKEIFSRPSVLSNPLSHHPGDAQRVAALESKLGESTAS